MARGVITVLAGLLISTLGYYALHGVGFSSAPSEPPPPARSSRAPVRLASLPRPARGESPTIRVCLTDSPVSSLRLQIDGPYSLRVVGSDQTIGNGQSLKECRVQCDRSGLKIGRRSYRTTRLEIVPQDSPAIWVNGHQYRGRVRLFRQPAGKILAVNVLPVEDYIASVIDSEMPAAFPEEARRAQAICSRTYALYQMAHSRSHPYFDVYSSTRSQNYLGYQYIAGGRRLAGETAKGREVAQATAGLVCTHQGQLFCTYYSAVCGGQTMRGDLVFTRCRPAAEIRALRLLPGCQVLPLDRKTQPTHRRQQTRFAIGNFAAAGEFNSPQRSRPAHARESVPRFQRPKNRANLGRRSPPTIVIAQRDVPSLAGFPAFLLPRSRPRPRRRPVPMGSPRPGPRRQNRRGDSPLLLPRQPNRQLALVTSSTSFTPPHPGSIRRCILRRRIRPTIAVLELPAAAGFYGAVDFHLAGLDRLFRVAACFDRSGQFQELIQPDGFGFAVPHGRGLLRRGVSRRRPG